MKERRITILLWMLFSVIVTVVVDLLAMWLANDNQWKNLGLDIVLEFTISIALFLGFYCVPFLFKRSRYPFVTCFPDEYYEGWLSRIADWKWCWLYVFPFLFAVAPGLIYYIMVGTSNLSDDPIFHNWIRTVVFVVIACVMLANYYTYLHVLKTKLTASDGDFLTKL